MQFKDVVGQQAAKQELVQKVNTGRLPHALQLLGAEGTGGLPLAIALAQYIFCEARHDGDSCGLCSGCQKVQRLEHADLLFSFPIHGSKVTSAKYLPQFRKFVGATPYGTTSEWMESISPESKLGNITAEECKHLVEALALRSYEGGAKVLILWRTEFLSKEGNMLLKLIEEPTPDTFLIFVTEQQERVLPTILSRLQTVRLRPLRVNEIEAALVSRGLAEGRPAAAIAQVSGGSFREALQLVHQEGGDLLPVLREWFNAIFTNNGFAIVRFVTDAFKLGRDPIRIRLEYALSLLESAIRISYLPEAANTMPEHEAAFAGKLAARKLPLPVLEEMAAAIAEAIMRITRNVHPKTVLMALCIRMQQALRQRQAQTA